MGKCAGYIGFVMVDQADNQIIELGGGGFADEAQWKQEWDAIVPFDGFSEFVADLEDADGSIISDKPVSAEQIEERLGRPISALIAEGRARAEKENAA